MTAGYVFEGESQKIVSRIQLARSYAMRWGRATVVTVTPGAAGNGGTVTVSQWPTNQCGLTTGAGAVGFPELSWSWPTEEVQIQGAVLNVCYQSDGTAMRVNPVAPRNPIELVDTTFNIRRREGGTNFENIQVRIGYVETANWQYVTTP
jgi:hypothetical protein